MNPRAELKTLDDRPIEALPQGQVIRELV